MLPVTIIETVQCCSAVLFLKQSEMAKQGHKKGGRVWNYVFHA